MSDVKKIAKNTSVLFVGDVIGRILSFLLIVAMARYLGDAGLGKYSFVFAFIGIFEVFSDFGLSTLLVREVARDKTLTRKYLHNILSIKLVLAIFSLSLPIIAILFLNEPQDVVVSVFIVSIATFFLYGRELLGVVFQAHERMEYYSISNVLERFVTVGLGALVLYLGYALVALTTAFLVSYALSFLVLLFFVYRHITHLGFSWDFDLWKKLLKDSLPFWLTGVFLLIYFRIDTIMLGLMQNYEVVGWYNAAYKALDALYFIPGAVVAAVYPVMSRYSINQKKELQLLFQKSFYYLFIIALPMGVGITMLADRIIYFVYGAEFVNSVLALQILIWAEVIIFVSSISGYLLNAINKQLLFTYATAFAAIMNIVLNFILIPTYSYLGASAATVVTEFLVLVLVLIFVFRSGFSLNFYRILFKPLLAALGMMGVIYFLTSLHLFLIVIIGAIFYFLLLFLLRGIGREEIDVVVQMIKRN